MDEVIDKIADDILEVCSSEDEVCALIDNVLIYIKDLVCDDEWQPDKKDLLLSMKDKLDDEKLECDVVDEDVEVIEDEEGFKSLR